MGPAAPLPAVPQASMAVTWSSLPQLTGDFVLFLKCRRGVSTAAPWEGGKIDQGAGKECVWVAHGLGHTKGPRTSCRRQCGSSQA